MLVFNRYILSKETAKLKLESTKLDVIDIPLDVSLPLLRLHCKEDSDDHTLLSQLVIMDVPEENVYSPKFLPLIFKRSLAKS